VVTTFFSDVLEHLLVEQQFGDESLEPVNFHLQLADAADLILLGRVEPLPPAIVGRGVDAMLAADVGDGQAPG
jgi:hypothetical protein